LRRSVFLQDDDRQGVLGIGTNQIAADLHLAPETVRNHVGSLLKTLGARSRLEATLVALRDGVVSLDLN